MMEELKTKLAKQIRRNILIKWPLKEALLESLPTWDSEKCVQFSEHLQNLDAQLYAEVCEKIKPEEKRKKVFHALAKQKVQQFLRKKYGKSA